MTLYAIPAKVHALIFDIDSTLYTHRAYADHQIDVLIRRLAQEKGQSYQAMTAAIQDYRRQWERDHGGVKISLANTFTAFGVSIEESIRWREDLIAPERFLTADPRLRQTLLDLGKSARLGVVTNNPVLIGRRTLRALGVEDCFKALVGLDSCGVSKPHRLPFVKVTQELGVEAPFCVSVGDRYDIDIALPVEMGMGGILVDGVEDVYQLKLDDSVLSVRT